MGRRTETHEGQIGDYWLSKRPNSPVWCRTWFDAKTRQTRRASLGTADFREAQLALAEWVVSNHTIRHQHPENVPLETVLVRFYENQAKESNSPTQARIALRFWSEFFAGDLVSELTPDRLDDFINWLRSKGHSNGYINRTLAAGRAALNRAHRRQEVQSVPFVPSVEAGEPRDIKLTPDEAAALFDACEERHIATFLMFAFNTLSRPSALLELKREQLDIESRLIHLNPKGRKQTKKYRLVVPITNSLLWASDQIGPSRF